MSRGSYGAGTIFKRGKIWYVAYWVDGKQVQRSSRSSRLQDAKRLRDELLGQKARGELSIRPAEEITCGELLDDVLAHAKLNAKPSTVRVWNWCIEANLRPYFGRMRAARVRAQTLQKYRDKWTADGRSQATCNRELSILRTAFNVARKRTPPKVMLTSYFPMVREENSRQGILTDEQYLRPLHELPDELKAIFVTAYFTGVRVGELLVWRWDQLDWGDGFVTLNANQTKTGLSRAIPIVAGDMSTWLQWAFEHSRGCSYVFNRFGRPIKGFRRAWNVACSSAGVPRLKFHDLRRTAVRNMTRNGTSQVVRMRITGHRSDSMERTCNIVDIDDLRDAKRRMHSDSQPERG